MALPLDAPGDELPEVAEPDDPYAQSRGVRRLRRGYRRRRRRLLVGATAGGDELLLLLLLLLLGGGRGVSRGFGDRGGRPDRPKGSEGAEVGSEAAQQARRGRGGGSGGGAAAGEVAKGGSHDRSAGCLRSDGDVYAVF